MKGRYNHPGRCEGRACALLSPLISGLPGWCEEGLPSPRAGPHLIPLVMVSGGRHLHRNINKHLYSFVPILNNLTFLVI